MSKIVPLPKYPERYMTEPLASAAAKALGVVLAKIQASTAIVVRIVVCMWSESLETT